MKRYGIDFQLEFDASFFVGVWAEFPFGMNTQGLLKQTPLTLVPKVFGCFISMKYCSKRITVR